MHNLSRSRKDLRRSRRYFICLALVLLLLTNACTFQVNNMVDAPDAHPGDGECKTAEGMCTLRAAVMEVNATPLAGTFGLLTPQTYWSHRIEVPAGVYELTLPSNAGGGSLTMTRGMQIQGAGASLTIIDGKQTHLAVYMQSGTVGINNLTLQGSNGTNLAGGVMRVDDTAELNNVIIRNGNATTGGGGLYVAGAGKVTIRRSSIVSNFAIGAFGGGIWNQGELWIYDSTIANNNSNRAGGIRNEGQMNLRSSTVSGNVAHSPDAGTGGISQNGFAVLNNVTVKNNTGVGNNPGGARGGGIDMVAGQTTVLKNSIIAGNHGGTGPDDCVGELSGDSKYNLIGDTNGCVIPSHVATYRLNVDPQLAPLTNNGGATETHLPAGTSEALETGYGFPPPAADACESRDQRGVPRPQGSGVCDMGAVEVTSANVFVTGLVLVDAGANADIRPLLHGDTLFLSELPSQLSIRAMVSGSSPGSVVFGYDDNPSFQTENISPYALGGDSPAGDYTPVALDTGTHTITATPFAAAAGAGAAGGSHSISFEVLSQR